MTILGSLQLGQALGLESLTLHPRMIRRTTIHSTQFELRSVHKLQSGGASRLGKSLLQDQWRLRLWTSVHVRTPGHHRALVPCASLASSLPAVPVQVRDVSVAVVKGMSIVFARALLLMRANPVVFQTVPAVGLIAFSVWGLAPAVRQLRKVFFKKSEKSWENSLTRQMVASYMRPIILWIGVLIICRAIDPLVLSTEASHAIKQRFVNFIRSLSTVLAFAFCTASLTQQIQKFMLDRQDSQEARNVGVQFIGNTVYTSVWVAAVCLFMELLGFSTQKWITAGGFGTVLLTLAGREIFTNFLSSVMIHATRPFVESEWIQTKIEGQEVSGTVEHVGWWSPTVIRGDDREAVHIPNHKFTVSVVRNLSQKSHWRIKTHFGISHLDVNKIKHIVADMRKVLAKHPSVEQQRLHRRVFFDNIDPENQALLILVSCFVKTPHFEEYLRVKEVILLDLLKVISHHGARLATPIRSVQRILDETESRQSPFRDVTARSENHRPFLLVEAAATTDSEKELVKVKVDSVESTMDRTLSPKAQVRAASPSNQGAEDVTDLVPKVEVKEKTRETKEPESKEKVVFSSEQKMSSPEAAEMSRPELTGIDATGLNASEISVSGAASEKVLVKTTEGPRDASPAEKMNSKPSSEERIVTKVPIDLVRPKNVSEQVVLKVGGGEETVAIPGAKAEKTSKSTGELTTEQKPDTSKVPFGERMVPVLTGGKAVLHVPLTDAEPYVDGFRTLTGENVLPLDEQGALADRNVPSSSKVEAAAGGDTNYSDDPWRDQSQASSPGFIAEVEKAEYVRANVRAGGGVSDERIAPLQLSQTWEENVLWSVTIEGTKRTLPLDDEMASPMEQKAQGGGTPSNPRPHSVEDMLIIGVALDGSQRTLPLGDDKSAAEQRELVTPRNGNGSS